MSKRGWKPGSMPPEERQRRSLNMKRLHELARQEGKPQFGGNKIEGQIRQAANALSDTLTLREMVNQLTEAGWRKVDGNWVIADQGGFINRKLVWQLRKSKC